LEDEEVSYDAQDFVDQDDLQYVVSKNLSNEKNKKVSNLVLEDLITYPTTTDE
jgi:hypothetical protein